MKFLICPECDQRKVVIDEDMYVCSNCLWTSSEIQTKLPKCQYEDEEDLRW